MKSDYSIETTTISASVTKRTPNAGFEIDAGKLIEWLKFVWSGPESNVSIDLNRVYPGRQFSPQTIYQGILESLEELKIPDVKVGSELIHESGPFSPFRTYLKIRREFSEFLVCAAPVGNSFFVTVRKIDRFRHVKWFHYLLLIGLGFLVYSGATIYFGSPGGFVFSMILVSLVWSLMRYGSFAATSWLGEHLHEMPLIGCFYLRWFRPDTYFRQDLHSAFLTLVGKVIGDVVAKLDPELPVRPSTESQGGPILKDLHQTG